jgi:hypothetical protein
MELDRLGWAPSPAGEPFGAAVREAATISDHEPEPVADVLNLKAVWLQERGGWAVINGKVLGEGDAILEFRVEKILADGVVVQGPGGRRQVGFKPASARPRPSAVIAASSPGKAPLKPTPGNPVTMQEVLKANDRLSGNLNFGNPVTLQDVTKAIGQALAQDGTAATGATQTPEKSSP